MKVAVVRAEHGRVVESYEFEATLEDIVKDIVRQVVEEWKPEESDLLVTRESREITVAGEVEEGVVRELEEKGLVAREGGSLKALVTIYYIYFDVKLEEESEEYVSNKVYVIAPLVAKEFKYELEREAASWTAWGEEPSGIRVE